MKKLLSIIGMTLILLGPPSLMMAQGSPDDTDDVIDTPFDGGLTLLLAAGAGLGAKKVHNMRKKRKEDAVK